MSFNLELGLILLQELALLALPLVAATMFAGSLGLRSPVLLVAVALAASGAAAMLVFWGFYAEPEIGKTLSFLIELGSVAAVLALFRSPGARAPLRELATPFALWILASYFVTYLGFLHGATGEPIIYASHRFAGALPDDNVLPGIFSDWFYAHGHHGPPPPFGEWLASDRPPLQTSYILGMRPFGWDAGGLHYQELGVALQMLWVPGAWALLRASDLGPRLRALAIVAAMFSDITIVHGFYVWPKLIAAGFLLAALAMAMSPGWKAWARDPRAGALFAALCTLGMLSHGSSAFLVVPLIVFAFWRALPDWRWIGAAAAAALLLYVPWTAYQHYADPPGNRLVKWQLGGNDAINDDGTLSTIVEGYREEGLDGTLSNKWTNVQAIVGVGEVRAVVDGHSPRETSGSLNHTIEDLRWVRFYGFLPLLGFLLLGPLAMAFRAAVDRGGGRGPEWRFALRAGALALAATAFWALAMFGNPISEAVLHQGCLAVPLLAIFACVAAAYAVDRRFAACLVAFNAIFVVALYVPVLLPPLETSYSFLAGLVAALALLGFLWVAWRPPWATESTA
ncbi:MAG: putative rane protein [Solirubrobacterales bacterium]|nr:putative rane protein [Solirubrobacterales bacterium]